MTAGCKSLINKFFPIDKSKGKRKQLAVAKQSCQAKLSGSNQTEDEAGQGAWGAWTKEVQARPFERALWNGLTRNSQRGWGGRKRMGSGGVVVLVVDGGWGHGSLRAQAKSEDAPCHTEQASLSALGNQPVKKQLSVQGRRATQTTWREKENALVPCALNWGASHHPGSGVEFQQSFLSACCVSHNPNSCSSLKLLEENLPSREPLCQSYICLCVSCYMHACSQAMWECFQTIIC